MAPSSVWTLFTKDKEKKTAKCNKCGKVFQNPSTSTARYHLLQVHFIATPKNPSNKRKGTDSSEAGAGSSEEDDPESTNGTNHSKVCNKVYVLVYGSLTLPMICIKRFVCPLSVLGRGFGIKFSS